MDELDDYICESCGEPEGQHIRQTEAGDMELMCSECYFDLNLTDDGDVQLDIRVTKIHGSAADRPDPNELPYEIVIYEETETEIEYINLVNEDRWVRIYSQPIEDVPTE